MIAIENSVPRISIIGRYFIFESPYLFSRSINRTEHCACQLLKQKFATVHRTRRANFCRNYPSPRATRTTCCRDATNARRGNRRDRNGNRSHPRRACRTRIHSNNTGALLLLRRNKRHAGISCSSPRTQFADEPDQRNKLQIRCHFVCHLQFWPASCDLSERLEAGVHQIGLRQNEFFLFYAAKVLPRRKYWR